ncbi:MAG: carbonic anhydrase [Nitrospiria bacterium]
MYQRHHARLDQLQSDRDKLNLLCELNVMEQVGNVCHSTVVQNGWRRGQELAVHGWIYSIQDGILRDLNICVTDPWQVPPIYAPSEGS